MTRPVCSVHGRRCPAGSHAPGDDSSFGYDLDPDPTGELADRQADIEEDRLTRAQEEWR